MRNISLAVLPSRPSTGLYSVCGRDELPSGHDDVALLSRAFKRGAVRCICLAVVVAVAGRASGAATVAFLSACVIGLIVVLLMEIMC